MIRCLAPFAWTMFALAYPDDAKVRVGTVGHRDVLETVNANVNKMLRQTGTATLSDKWLIWPDKAWCHDYAVTKRHILLGRGWPSSALLLAECKTARGEGHMVLIADGLCLDNLRSELLPWDSTGYDWSLPMQTAEDPNRWEAFEPHLMHA